MKVVYPPCILGRSIFPRHPALALTYRDRSSHAVSLSPAGEATQPLENRRYILASSSSNVYLADRKTFADLSSVSVP